MSWMNSDGLYVKFGKEEADTAAGGHYNVDGATKSVEVTIPYSEFASTTPAIVGSVGNPGARGVILPKGAVIEKVTVVCTEAFTASAGTLGSASLVLGTKEAGDRSTEADHDGLTTSSATVTALGLATLGSITELVQGSTGHGADIGGSPLAENQVLVASNATHGTNTLDAGEVKVRIDFR